MGKNEAREARREKMRQRAKDRQGKGGGSGHSYINLPDGVEFWGPQQTDKDKVTPLDFLHYKVSGEGHPDGIDVGDQWHTRPILVHTDVGPGKDRVLCPKTFGVWPKGKTGSNAPCPICEEYERQAAVDANWNDKEAKERMKKLRPKWRELYNVMCLNEDEPTMKVFEFSAHSFTIAFNQALEETAESDEGVYDFAELEDGRTVNVKWRAGDLTITQGKNKGEQILQVRTPDQIAFEKRDDYTADWADEVIDLDSILVSSTYEEIEGLFMGLAGSEAGGDADTSPAETEKPKARSGRRRGTPAADAEAPEEKPAASSRRRRPKTDPEPDAVAKKEDVLPLEEDDVPEGFILCAACEGDRVNTRGKVCRICDGEGCVEDPDADTAAEAPAEEPAAATSRPRRRRRA